MGDITAPQSFVLAVIRANADEIRASTSNTLAVYNVPTDNLAASTGYVTSVINRATTMKSTLAAILAVVRGRTNDPNVRAWTFTLDGHDFYVLRLGNIETLVYDVHSEQWHVWGSDVSHLWRAYNGCNWIDAGFLANSYGSSVVVGDDSSGAVYFLNPDVDADDDAVEGAAVSRPFVRDVQGMITQKGYGKTPCYGVQLIGSVGETEDSVLSGVTLSYSDDSGNNYTDAGTINLTPDVTDARLYWRSLGSMQSPGRLFRIIDNGALKRIDSLDMDGPVE